MKRWAVQLTLAVVGTTLILAGEKFLGIGIVSAAGFVFLFGVYGKLGKSGLARIQALGTSATLVIGSVLMRWMARDNLDDYGVQQILKYMEFAELVLALLATIYALSLVFRRIGRKPGSNIINL